MAFDSIESKIDRRWVPAAQSFEQARKDILTIIRFLTGERTNIKRAMRDYWLDITLPYCVVDELRTEVAFASVIRCAELDAQGL